MGKTLADGMAQLPAIQQLVAKYGPIATWGKTSSSPAGELATPPLSCARCKGQGWLWKLGPGENENEQIRNGHRMQCPECPPEEDDAALQDRLWRLSGVADRERHDYTFGNWKASANPEMAGTFELARIWSEGTGKPFLSLFSQTRGVGKTHLAIAAAQRSIERGEAVAYFVVPNFLDALRATIRDSDGPSVADVRRRAEQYPAVILDDLGADTGTDWAQEQLYAVVNERWRHGLRTFVTSNVPITAIESRIASRLRDVRLGEVVACKGRDFRQMRGVR